MTRNTILWIMVIAMMALVCISCEDGTGTGETEVVEQAISIENVFTNVLVLLDRSESMLGYGFLPYVADSVANLTLEMEDFARFGLMVYPGAECKPNASIEESCAAPSEPYVYIDPVYSTADEVNDVFDSWVDGVGVCGATPTAAALDVAHDYLDEFGSKNPTMILLITDGAPNCNQDAKPGCTCTDSNSLACMSYPHLCLDDSGTNAAAQRLKAAGYPVYVLSIGDAITPFDDVMNAIASAGGSGAALTAKEFADVDAKVSQVQPEMYSCQVDVNWNDLGAITGESKISDMAGKISLTGKISQTDEISESQKISYSPNCENNAGFDVTADNKISLCSNICDSLKTSKISKISASAKISKISATN